MKSTDVEKLSEPFCPEPHVRPPPHFHVNFTLTSFSPSQTHILLPSLWTVVDGMRPMSNILVVYAPNNGHLKLSMRTAVIVGAQWTCCTCLNTCGLIILLGFGVCLTRHYFILRSTRYTFISSRRRRTLTGSRPIIRLHS